VRAIIGSHAHFGHLAVAIDKPKSLLLELPEEGVSLEAIERELLLRALERFKSNQTQAARYLDISRRTGLTFALLIFSSCALGGGTQSCDPLLEGWMAHEQAFEARSNSAVDSQRCQLW
jgi:Bacterial regulatory protein, Fis family